MVASSPSPARSCSSTRCCSGRSSRSSPTSPSTYDLTKLEAGALLGAYGAGALVGGIPGGLLVGRIGPKRGLLVGLAVLALASLAFALAGGPVALGVARFVQGVSSATTWAGALAWVAMSAPRERRGQALGTVFGLAVLGFVVGPMFGGVADIVGIRLVVRRGRARRRRAGRRALASPRRRAARRRAGSDPTCIA